jgi:hypothetical protein
MLFITAVYVVIFSGIIIESRQWLDRYREEEARLKRDEEARKDDNIVI